MTFQKIAILGPGLLGGSIALGWRKRSPRTRLAVWARREAAAAEARERQIADIVSTRLDEVVAEADAVVFCIPVGGMAVLAEKLAPLVAPGALVTDVGSVKAPVARALAPIFAGRAHFIGSHPMAGSELTGLAAARADLFHEAACILTPDAATDARAAELAGMFWRQLGCRMFSLPPEEHDAAVALISHLPHLLAAALVNTVSAENPAAFALCGSGFRDTTRVASGPPAMWAEILRENRAGLEHSAHAMIETLRAMLTLLGSGDAGGIEQSLADAKAARDRLTVSSFSK